MTIFVPVMYQLPPYEEFEEDNDGITGEGFESIKIHPNVGLKMKKTSKKY